MDYKTDVFYVAIAILWYLLAIHGLLSDVLQFYQLGDKEVCYIVCMTNLFLDKHGRFEFINGDCKHGLHGLHGLEQIKDIGQSVSVHCPLVRCMHSFVY